MTLHTRLQRRKENGIYYCRVAVPERIRHIIGKKEIHISLRTNDVMLAQERVKAESYRIDQLLLKASGRNPEAVASKPITPLPPNIISRVDINGLAGHLARVVGS